MIIDSHATHDIILVVCCLFFFKKLDDASAWTSKQVNRTGKRNGSNAWTTAKRAEGKEHATSKKSESREESREAEQSTVSS